MGATFPNPKYFYDETDVPDLVDTNGPIYARTGVNLSNIIPTSVEVIACSSDREHNESRAYSVLTHDVHVTRTAISPMEGDGEDPILAVGLSGYIALQPNLAVVGESPCDSIVVTVSFEDFNPGGTCQAPIVCALAKAAGTQANAAGTQANAFVSAGSACLYGEGGLSNRYDGGTIKVAKAVLPYNGSVNVVMSLRAISFF